MKRKSRLVVLLMACLMTLIGLSAAPANAAPRPISFTHMEATITTGGPIHLEFNVKCDSTMIYQFRTSFVFQNGEARFDDDPGFLFTPCGSHEVQDLGTGTGPFTLGKAELVATLNLCQASDPTVCSVVEVRKDIRLRAPRS